MPGAATRRTAAVESEDDPITGPIISIPDEPVYELPTRVRRHRADHDDLEADAPAKGWSGSKKLALILAMCFAIGATIVFIVLSNSGPTVPVQVLDTRSGTMTPPPEGMELPTPAHRSTLAQTTASRTQTPPPQYRSRQEPLPLGSRPVPATPPPVLPAQGAEVNDVEMLTEPPGAKMVVDSRPDLSCNAPCTLSLPNGRHTLSAELAGFNVSRRIFTVPNDSSLFVNLGKSMGVVVVTSSLSGCTVLVDGHQSGYTPATLHLTAGSHRIAVVSKSSRHEETVQVQQDGFDVERFLCQ